MQPLQNYFGLLLHILQHVCWVINPRLECATEQSVGIFDYRLQLHVRCVLYVSWTTAVSTPNKMSTRGFCRHMTHSGWPAVECGSRNRVLCNIKCVLSLTYQGHIWKILTDPQRSKPNILRYTEFQQQFKWLNCRTFNIMTDEASVKMGRQYDSTRDSWK